MPVCVTTDLHQLIRSQKTDSVIYVSFGGERSAESLKVLAWLLAIT